MRIEKVVESLCRECGTRNPYEIASYKNIRVLFESLGTLRGYYNKRYRYRMIHINNAMSEESQRFTCAHELGHAILHPAYNAIYLQTNTLYCMNRYENEANYFAADLLISNEDLREYEAFSIPELSSVFCMDEKLIEHRLKSLRK
ncbi:uncharacterized protein DUF955 [Clostridium sp. KNHs216]|nr:uncharacterized protein DUF955 [Clostridium sp. KNHs216]